jgi:hypothetical protein
VAIAAEGDAIKVTTGTKKANQPAKATRSFTTKKTARRALVTIAKEVSGYRSDLKVRTAAHSSSSSSSSSGQIIGRYVLGSLSPWSHELRYGWRYGLPWCSSAGSPSPARHCSSTSCHLGLPAQPCTVLVKQPGFYFMATAVWLAHHGQKLPCRWASHKLDPCMGLPCGALACAITPAYCCS